MDSIFGRVLIFSIQVDLVGVVRRRPSEVMIVGHGNTLRALVKIVDGISDADVFHLDLPTATPLLYESRRQ